MTRPVDKPAAERVIAIEVLPPKTLMMLADNGEGEVTEDGPNKGEQIFMGSSTTDGKPFILYRSRYATLDCSMSMFVEFCCRAINAQISKEEGKEDDEEKKKTPSP